MSLLLQRPGPVPVATDPPGKRPAGDPFAPRPVPPSWPGTLGGRAEILETARLMPLITHTDGLGKRLMGMGLLLDWLAEQPGPS